MKIRKYTLPRHTILAKPSYRIGAFFIDLAITLAIFLGLYYGIGKPLAINVFAKDYKQQTLDFEFNSNLAYKDEDGNVVFYKTTSDVMTSNNLEPIVKYYYLNYLTGSNLKEGFVAAPNANEEQTFFEKEGKVLPINHYTVRWYNETVLGITGDDPDSPTSTCYFKWKLDGEGRPLKDEFGVARSQHYDKDLQKLVDVTETKLLNHFVIAYNDCKNNLFYSSFYETVADKTAFIYSLCFLIPVVIAGIVSYILIPLFMKHSATVGKKIMKLGLASMQGYKYNKLQLLLRFVPYLLTCFLCGIISGTVYGIFIVITVMFLGSYGVSIASPKKCSFHDYTGQSIVVDVASSIIFDDFLEEEIYLNKEDGLNQEVINLEDGEGGEEPELKYEK